MSSAIFIDGNSLLHRAFYALPTTMKTKDGRYTNAVYGFINMLLTLTSNYSPEYIAVAFDVKKHTFRNDMYEQYKAGRRSTPFELVNQFPLIREVLKKLDIKYIELEGYEGDDILGTLSLRAEEQGVFTYLVTGDKDALQLVSNSCHVLMTKKGVSEIEEYSVDHLKEAYDLTPDQIIDLKGLMGDSSDNIPGVAGVGEKTALKLLNQFGSVEKLYDNIEALPKNKLYEKLVKDKDNALLSKELATIKVDVPLNIQINELKFQGFDDKALIDTLADLEFSSLIRRLGLKAQPKPSLKTTELKSIAEIESIVEKLYKKGVFAFYLDGQRAYFGDGSTEYTVEFTNDLFGEGVDEQNAFKAFSKLFEAPEVKLYLHSAKALYHLLYNYKIKCCSLVHDTQIAAYVLNPTRRKFDLNDLKSEYDISGYSSAIYQISQIQRRKIESDDLAYVLDKIELPLIDVLFDMEITGFTVDRNKLKKLSQDYADRINDISEQIFELAGEPFNIGSTKQLAEILFVKLGLPAKKKTKTGYSTDAEVLESLSSMHPIIGLIMEYRQLTKLKSTYIEGFLNVTTEFDTSVHTTFNQTATATGRISSTEPNLQNIPIKSELSHDIREVFIPSKKDNFIVSADYSQIELRVLAHIANDENMIDAFLNGEDIHTRTASEVFDVPKDMVTPNMRSSAKAVNFGIVYGISDFGLARNLGIPKFKAAEYIEKYLQEFSGVDRYMKEIVVGAKKDGFVKTLFGRIRYIEELSSSNYNTRSFGERAAMNTPIQGTAADIIKIAMIAVYNKLKEKGLHSKLILQVHDELVIDTVPDEVNQVKEILVNEMKNAFDLKVPLEVHISVDKTF